MGEGCIGVWRVGGVGGGDVAVVRMVELLGWWGWWLKDSDCEMDWKGGGVGCICVWREEGCVDFWRLWWIFAWLMWLVVELGKKWRL